jgi:hypothetical protein
MITVIIPSSWSLGNEGTPSFAILYPLLFSATRGAVQTGGPSVASRSAGSNGRHLERYPVSTCKRYERAESSAKGLNQAQEVHVRMVHCPRDWPPVETGGQIVGTGASGQVMVRGIVACTVVSVLTFFLPLRVVTFSVTWTVTEFGPATSLALGVPDNTPAEDTFSPFGQVTFFH